MKTAVEQASLKNNFQMANAFRVMGRYEEALKHYAEVLRYDVKHHQTLNDMGVVYVNLKKLKLAIKVFSKAVKYDSENVTYLFNLGYAEYKNKLPYVATDHLLKVVELDPNHARAHWHLHEIYALSKDMKASKMHLLAILKIKDSRNQLIPLAEKRLKYFK